MRGAQLDKKCLLTLLSFLAFPTYWRKTMKLRLPQASVLGCLFFFLCAGIVYGLFSSRLPAIKAQTQADEAQSWSWPCFRLGVGSGYRVHRRKLCFGLFSLGQC